MNFDFNTYLVEDIIPSKDGRLILIREVEIKYDPKLEKGKTYIVEFGDQKKEEREFNR